MVQHHYRLASQQQQQQWQQQARTEPTVSIGADAASRLGLRDCGTAMTPPSTGNEFGCTAAQLHLYVAENPKISEKPRLLSPEAMQNIEYPTLCSTLCSVTLCGFSWLRGMRGQVQPPPEIPVLLEGNEGEYRLRPAPRLLPPPTPEEGWRRSRGEQS